MIFFICAFISYLKTQKILRARDGCESKITGPGHHWYRTWSAAEAPRHPKSDQKALWNVNEEFYHYVPSATPH